MRHFTAAETNGNFDPVAIFQELLAKFGADCSEIATIAKDAKLEGRNMSMFLSPKNSK